MDNSFFPRTWRGKDIPLSEEEENMPLGEFDLLRIERKFVLVTSNFIQSIFSYDKIQVQLEKKDSFNSNAIGYSGKLESANGHTTYSFASKLFDDKFYEFTVINIPVTSESRHIKIFFSVLMRYFTYFYDNIKKTLPSVDGNIKASPDFIAKSEIWLYNIQRIIVIEYIYNVFNAYDEDYSNDFKWIPNNLRYDLDLINTILDFSSEISTKKIENKEIYCGFIFHDHTSEIRDNSVRNIRFEKPLPFGDFNEIKNYLEISNGQNMFFNVTKDKITHLFITKEKLNEIDLNPMGDGKLFYKRPLILSVQGAGKVYFLEGRSDQNKVILQVINSKPVIRDNDFIKQFIFSTLTDFLNVEEDKIRVFSKWIMSLSQKKHGTSLIFSDMNKQGEKKLVKMVKIEFDNQSFLDTKISYDISLLESIINPDGAVLFNKELLPTHIGTILPISQSAKGAAGGSRHNSIANFTKNFNCLGIVISEDGPITIFKEGNKLIKF